MQRWEEAEPFLVGEAARDLEAGANMARPCLVGFRGEQPLVLAFLREFDKGEYADPIVEVLTIAGGLGADRLMFSITGRAWSLEDPIPPVARGAGDLRQRVLHISRVDGAGGQITARDVLWPFDVRGAKVRWGDRMETEPSQGWIPQALRLAVEHRDELRASDADVRAQVLRCDRLGHLVGLRPEISRQLDLEPPLLDRPIR